MPTTEAPQGMGLDKGYDEVHDLRAEFGFTAPLRARGEEAHALTPEAGFKARRWVVERTPSWMNRRRRLLIRGEKQPENYLGLLHLCLAYITFAQTSLVG